MTGNVQSGHMYICNCCKCCCGVLRSINEFGIPASLVMDSCTMPRLTLRHARAAAIQKKAACQVGAIEELQDSYRVVEEPVHWLGICIKT